MVSRPTVERLLLKLPTNSGQSDQAIVEASKTSGATDRGVVSLAVEEMRSYPRGEMRDFLTSVLSAVELDPVESTVRLDYRIPLSRNSVASPGGLAAIPTLIFNSLARVA